MCPLNCGIFLPFDEESEEPFNRDSACGGCLLTGDVRASDNTAFTGMHTIFLPLHNRYATNVRRLNRYWSSAKIFKRPGRW